MCDPLPFPAHQTRRVDFPHLVFRPVSWRAHDGRHPVASNEEITHAVVDVRLDYPVPHAGYRLPRRRSGGRRPVNCPPAFPSTWPAALRPTCQESKFCRVGSSLGRLLCIRSQDLGLGVTPAPGIVRTPPTSRRRRGARSPRHPTPPPRTARPPPAADRQRPGAERERGRRGFRRPR